MGCGKSTVGRALARRLRWDFIDLDHLIEHRAGKRITEIFEQSGEAGFREIEGEVLVSLQEFERVVVATGGGIVTHAENLERLRSLGYVVWLDVPEEEVYQRIAHSTHRPLLHTENPRETVRKLFALREPMYRAAADCIIAASRSPRRKIIDSILQRAGQYFGTAP